MVVISSDRISLPEFLNELQKWSLKFFLFFSLTFLVRFSLKLRWNLYTTNYVCQAVFMIEEIEVDNVVCRVWNFLNYGECAKFIKFVYYVISSTFGRFFDDFKTRKIDIEYSYILMVEIFQRKSNKKIVYIKCIS